MLPLLPHGGNSSTTLKYGQDALHQQVKGHSSQGQLLGPMIVVHNLEGIPFLRMITDETRCGFFRINKKL